MWSKYLGNEIIPKERILKNETRLYLNKAVKKKKVEEKPEAGVGKQGIRGSKQSSSCIFFFASRVASLWPQSAGGGGGGSGKGSTAGTGNF